MREIMGQRMGADCDRTRHVGDIPVGCSMPMWKADGPVGGQQPRHQVQPLCTLRHDSPFGHPRNPAS